MIALIRAEGWRWALTEIGPVAVTCCIVILDVIRHECPSQKAVT